MINQVPSRDPNDDDSLLGVFRFVLKKHLQNTDDMLPAKIVSYDRQRNRATVQILISNVLTDNTILNRQVFVDIPVLTLGGGGVFISFNLPANSLGWIKAADRDISLFLASYNQQAPNTQRLHTFEDSLFIPDVMTGFSIASEDLQSAVIQNTDGSVKIALDDTGVRITASTVTINGNLDVSGDVTAGGSNVSLTTHTHTTTSSGDPTSPPN